MVAAGQHHLRPSFPQLRQRLVQHLDGVRRGQRPVIHVSGDQHEVDPAVPHDLGHLGEDLTLGVQQAGAVEGAADVPVGGVEDQHAHHGSGAPGRVSVS